jgi:hypothetical protein
MKRRTPIGSHGSLSEPARPAASAGKIFLAVLLSILGLSNAVQAQMNNWVMPPFKFDMTTSAAGTGPLYTGAPTSGQYYVANGAYDQNNGALLFYVENASIYKPNGTLLGSLGVSSWGQGFGGEIVILPVPGHCRAFYVIYSVGFDVQYTMVDCYGAVPQIDKGGGYGNPGGGYYVANLPQWGTALAASKRMPNPNGPGFIYYLYMVNNQAVYYSVVDNLGITPASFITGGGPSTNKPSTELELSEDGKYLAFNGIDYSTPSHIQQSGDIWIVELSNHTTFVQLFNYHSPSTILYGLELVGAVNPVLFVCGEKYFPGPGAFVQSVFDKLDFINGGSPIDLRLPPPPLSYVIPFGPRKTFLEYSKAGKVCYVCMDNNNRYFVEYDDVNSTYITTQIDVAGLDVDPNGVSGWFLFNQLDKVYTLPDQLDGENYNVFTTTPYTYLDYCTVNEGPVKSTDGAPCQFNEVYNCNPINVEAFFNIEDPNVCESYFDINEVAADCTPLSGSGIYFNCYNCGGEFIGGDNPWKYDLRGFSDGFLSLYTHTGYFKVTWHIVDCCGNHSSKVMYIRILGAIVNINLKIYKTAAPAGWFAPSTNIAMPVNVGSSSIGYEVSQSSGNITGYNALIQEVDNTGVVSGAGTIYNQTFTMNNINAIGIQNLNSLCVPASVWPSNPGFGGCVNTNPASTGYFGYWSYTNALYSYNKYYKITVTLFNECSSSSAFSYVYVNSIGNRPANVTSLQAEEQNVSPSIFPNPATNEMFISATGSKVEPFNLELTDMMGRTVLKFSGRSGPDPQSVDISTVPAGVYLWKYVSDGNSNVGKVQVLR